MANFTLRLPDHEEQIIQDYCKANQRSKTDVLREYIRSLAPAGQKQAEAAPANESDIRSLLLPGWKSCWNGNHNFFAGDYRGIYIEIYVNKDNVECFIGGGKGVELATTNVLIAIAHAQELVDSWSASDGEAWLASANEE